jgi:hypothetical protein
MPDTDRDWRLFVSHATEDALVVGLLVQIIRAAETSRRNVVFWARDSIQPGADWKVELEKSMTAARKALVFWCAHSASSEWVKWEYELALQLKKVTVPVRLDDTPLPPPLNKLQAIDCRPFRTHSPRRDDGFDRRVLRRSFAPETRSLRALIDVGGISPFRGSLDRGPVLDPSAVVAAFRPVFD